jgi:cytochrome c peroxidase
MTQDDGRRRSCASGWIALCLVGVLAACGGSSDEGPLPVQAAPTTGPTEVDVGEFLFKDTRLSASGRMACATCHDERFGHADVPGTGLPLGGVALSSSGMRSSATSRYLNANPPFSLDLAGHPVGGFAWDGRFDSRKQQAGTPFFVAAEMALPGSIDNPKAVTDLVRSADYYADLVAVSPGMDLSTDAGLFDRILELIEIYQRDDEDYNLFDSRFDQVLAGMAAFSAEEQRGLAIFSDANRGNCASCHSIAGPQPSLTDFRYAALAVPRNHAGPKNADPAFFELGLCARDKAEDSAVAGVERYCGLWKTPTLRNVERTAPYFHNGAIATLEEAVRFHFTRDTDAARWYRRPDGSADVRYNDLPAAYHANVARGKPFDGSWQPSDTDVAALIAFLKTLNDADQTEPLR